MKRLERDLGADALARLRRDGVGDVCPYCSRGHLEPMKEGALLGIKRPEKSELYPCTITSCSWCGHIALFDSSFRRPEIDQPDLPSEWTGKWTLFGGQTRASGEARSTLLWMRRPIRFWPPTPRTVATGGIDGSKGGNLDPVNGARPTTRRPIGPGDEVRPGEGD